jgi:hypothetical protein
MLSMSAWYAQAAGAVLVHVAAGRYRDSIIDLSQASICIGAPPPQRSA